MSITIDAQPLRAASREAAAVASSSANTVPIFANVLIQEQAEGWVRFVATDLDTWIERRVQAVTGELGRTPLNLTVSAKYLSAIAGKLPEATQVALTVDGKQLRLRAGRSDFRLATLPADEFAECVMDKAAVAFDMRADLLAELLDRLAFAMSTEETRYYLNGIYLHCVEVDGTPMLRAAATDGSRLARAQVPRPDGAEGFPEKGIIIPRRAVGVLRQLIERMKPGTEESPRTIGVVVTERLIDFDLGASEHGETRFTAKLVDGQFPDYTRVIPAANPRHLKIETPALKEAVERVATIVTAKERAMKVSIAKDLVTLSVVSAELGQAEEEVPADYSGDPFDIGFNSRFLLDVLARIDGPHAIAELADPAAPTLWRDADQAEVLFVIMPLRV